MKLLSFHHKSKIRLMAPALCAMIATTTMAAEVRYSVQGIGTSEGMSSEAWDINNDGVVVGSIQGLKAPVDFDFATHRPSDFGLTMDDVLGASAFKYANGNTIMLPQLTKLKANSNGVQEEVTLGSHATGINSSGQIVGHLGFLYFGGDFSEQTEAFLSATSGDGIRTLAPMRVEGNTDGYRYSQVTAINDSGVVTGAIKDNFDMEKAYIFANDQLLKLEFEGATSSTGTTITGGIHARGWGHDITNSGLVTGQVNLVGSDESGNTFDYNEAFIMSFSRQLDAEDGVTLVQESVKLLGSTSEGRSSAGFGINEAGHATGSWTNYTRPYESVFYYDGEEMKDAGRLDGSDDCQGLSINSSNQIVGKCQYSSNYEEDRAVYFDPSLEKVIDLNTLIEEDSGWVLSSARAINDDGQIVGRGIYEGKVRAFLLQLVATE